ncbi:hypothetical protein FGADI_9424 [Fusarium gaditjirri]|uniref:CBS domain-containing protein n=1 Tax=Fusarium gaditjirri TaxID=282569 RepID=A0A8H4WSY4_9HYPO|nr:hypothetical protein FGADI_9424 [Fusarium gaditjirri]
MSGNTYRGTPTRNQGRGAVPFTNSPSGGSSIPRPVLEPSPPTETGSAVSASRQKQSKRDEAIRKKLENDLSKKKHLTSRARHSRKAPPGTVLALKPSQALQIKPGTTVSEAAQLMAAKREDCVLVTDDDDRIAGIFTAKDLAFRVVGAGAKASAITIAEIMTKNPLCARTDTSATDALDLMVRKGFRHLPVMDENQDISGVLDITKCFYDAMEKLERAYSSSRKLYDALEGVQSELGSTQPQQIIQYVEALRSKMSGPTLETVLNGVPPTTVSVRTSVKEAAQLMKENRTTAVLVQDQGAITGIFTSKDVVLRVIAPGLDPANCSVVRVMTPHPDFAPMDMTLQAALRKMHDGHYLNLPVMNDGGEIVGMVDVLKLTYATLDQINAMSNTNDEGPAWNKFWLSLDAETESMMSGEGSAAQHTNLGSRLTSPDMHRGINDSLAPGDSASHVGMESPPRSVLPDVLEHQLPEELPFPFKFKAPSGRVHRLKVTATEGIEVFVNAVASKLGAEADSIGGVPPVSDGKIAGPGFAMSFLDDEGDSISITADHDLLEAVILARQAHHDKVDLFVHDPEKPPVSGAPATPSVSAGAGLRERRKWWPEEDDDDSEDEDDEDEPVRRRKGRATHTHAQGPEQLIAGVPNELILPGAIVTLAVTIIGVFTIARLTSRRTTTTITEQSPSRRHDPEERPRAALSLARQMSTQVTTKTETTAEEWKTIQAAVAPPKIVSAARKKQRIVQDGILSLRTNSAHEHRGAAWTTPHSNSNSAVPATPAQQYKEWQRIQANTRSLGSKLEKRYIPTELVNNPPGPEDITLEMLMASQTHIGHKTSLWNPANSRYIYGVRQGVHIISLETTAAHLRRAARVVEEVAYKAGLILFVGNRKGQMEIVTQAAEMAGACHLFTKWTPGAITNRDVILKMAGTKIVDHKDQELPGFESYRGSARPLMPDLVVCLNPLENYTLLYECGLKSIPTIGVIDTNVDPSWVTYTIPANDDSLRAMAVVGGVLGRAGQRGQQRRMADAKKKNMATWENSPDIVQHMNREKKAALAERKNVMGQMQHNLEGFNEEEQKILREGLYGDELEVTESEMVDMMGEAALGAAKEVAAKALSALPDQPVGPGPESPVQAAASEVVVEAQTKSTTSSPEQPIASEAATSPPEQPAAPEAVANVQSDIKAADPAQGSRLANIEDQLLGLKNAAEAIEADIKSGKQ